MAANKSLVIAAAADYNSYNGQPQFGFYWSRDGRRWADADPLDVFPHGDTNAGGDPLRSSLSWRLSVWGRSRRGRVAIGTAAVALVAAGVFVSSRPAVGTDGFRELAPVLERAPAGALVTAAPDAYGFLLPQRPVRAFRAGEEGLVLVDGAARGLAPGLRVDGKLLRRIEVIMGFRRPDGVVDRSPVLLYRGRVVGVP